MSFTVNEIAAPHPLRSLTWGDDELVDWIGGLRIALDGGAQEFGAGYDYRFDAATGLGDVGVRFETLGTKGSIERFNGRLPTSPQFLPLGVDFVREIDRSFYRADNYAYPVCVFRLPDGREAIAHCPRSYDTLELELLDGTPLTRRDAKSDDIFHSRLAASPDGRWLLSNGWVWQPWNIVAVYDVARALRDPAHLAGVGITLDLGAFEAEVDAATFSGDRVIVSASGEQPMLSVIELPTGKTLHCTSLSEYLGTRIMAWGPDHVVALDGQPRIVAIEDGALVHAFDDLRVAASVMPSVAARSPEPPLVAIDPRRARFAVTEGTRVVVVTRS